MASLGDLALQAMPFPAVRDMCNPFRFSACSAMYLFFAVRRLAALARLGNCSFHHGLEDTGGPAMRGTLLSIEGS